SSDVRTWPPSSAATCMPSRPSAACRGRVSTTVPKSWCSGRAPTGHTGIRPSSTSRFAWASTPGSAGPTGPRPRAAWRAASSTSAIPSGGPPSSWLSPISISRPRRGPPASPLDRRMRVYLAPKLLIIDEFGVWPYDRLAATAFFSLVSARYERGSILLTSNKGFGEWGEVLGDPVIATAILDRLLHHSHVLNIRGESYRLREKKQAGLLGVSLVPGPPAGRAEEDATPSTRLEVGQFSTGETGSRVRRR